MENFTMLSLEEENKLTDAQKRIYYKQLKKYLYNINTNIYSDIYFKLIETLNSSTIFKHIINKSSKYVINNINEIPMYPSIYVVLSDMKSNILLSDAIGEVIYHINDNKQTILNYLTGEICTSSKLYELMRLVSQGKNVVVSLDDDVTLADLIIISKKFNYPITPINLTYQDDEVIIDVLPRIWADVSDNIEETEKRFNNNIKRVRK